MGYPDWLEVDLLYYLWFWIWAKRSPNGVSAIGYPGGSTCLLMTCNSWAHEICSEDNEERSLVIGSMNEMAYVLQAWLPLIVWQQVDAPEYRKGFITVSCLSVLLILGTLVVRRLDLKERREKG